MNRRALPSRYDVLDRSHPWGANITSMGLELIDRLFALPPAQFNRLIHDLGVAPDLLSGEAAPQHERSVALVRYFKQPSRDPSTIEAAIGRLVSSQQVPCFVALYRLRLSSKFARWGPGTLGTTASPRRVEAPFDEMYQPLRLRRRAMGDAPKRAGADSDVVLDATKLLSEPEHIAIAGTPGSGKTTWMRAAFRALIGRDDALPLFVTLRDLARLWTKAPREDRSFDTFLKSMVAEHVPEAEPGGLAGALSYEAGPRPVLLVDGWDELGPLGGEVHEKLLGFLARYPRVRAVVTSRPFGVNIPSAIDGFAALEVQSLSDVEVHTIAQRFVCVSPPADAEQKARQLALFFQSLDHSPPARELARTPLLLVMMLMVSRSRPLPKKRHLLYRACIESLLGTIPDEKEEEGALLPRPQYRPEDAEERIRITAALAARTEFVSHDFEEMAALLPTDWPAVVSAGQTRHGMRAGFLQWLAGTAGLLTVNADDTVVFTHRSLQEFLAAWHWSAIFQDAHVLAREVLVRVPDRQWWETLRLLAALAAERDCELLTPVISTLLSQDNGGRLLCGLLLADGLGPESAVEAWLPWFVSSVATAWTNDWSVCLAGWSAGPLQSRLQRLADALWERSKHSSFPEWLRLSYACMQLQTPVVTPLSNSLAGAAVRWLHTMLDEPRAVAAGRVFCGTFPVWPDEPYELGLLQLWPNARRLFGTRLQLAILCGAERSDVQRLARARWPGVSQVPPLDLMRARSLVEKCAVFDWALNIDDFQLAFFADTWVTEVFRALSAELQIEGFYQYVERSLVRQGRDWLRHFGTFEYGVTTDNGEMHFLPRHQVPPHIPHMSDQLSALSAMQSLALREEPAWQQALELLWGEQAPAAWLRDFVNLDSGAIDRYGVVPVVAVRDREGQPIGLLARACRLALTPASNSAVAAATVAFNDGNADLPANNPLTAFDEALNEFTGDSMWPALARHLCNRATDDDRQLLTSLATSPGRAPPLSWGLQYIVRGDLVFGDGTEMTLDQLADDLGLPHLPILEPLLVSAGALDQKTAWLTGIMLHARRQIPKQAYVFNDEFMCPIKPEERVAAPTAALSSLPSSAVESPPSPSRPHGAANRDNSAARGTTVGIDVLIVTAVKEEYDEALKVQDGGLDEWLHETGPTGFEVAFRTYRTASGTQIRVALTRAPEMRGVAASNAAWPLIQKYNPRCLAMCGVCAGRRGDTNLGDVIVGDLLYTYDAGTVVAEYDANGKRHERFKGEPSPYRLDGRWKQRAESFLVASDAEWLKTRPLSLESQCNWLLERLFAGEADPAQHPERSASCPAWKEAITRLRKLELVTSSGLALTPKGRVHVEELRILHPDGRPTQPPFRILVAPMATGSSVVRDQRVFERLSDSMRKVIGLEMEAAAIGAIANVSGIRMLVMKGVMDHADEDKDDGFKSFAARASAECLISFLRKNMTPESEAPQGRAM